MNAVKLLKYFDRISDAPDAVPRLRRFILDLAVRGKLVERDSNDEPAAELLKRIQAEKVRLVKIGAIRKQPILEPVSADEQPFEVGRKWCWVRFGEIAEFSAGRTPSRHDTSFWNTGDYPWISIADMTTGETIFATKETVSEKAKQKIFSAEPSPVGTLIMSFKLSIGKIARLGVPAFHNEAIISIRPHIAQLENYLFMLLPQFSRMGNTKDAIKGATLNRDSLTNILLPLPPLAEQNRIIAKVDELMSLCDQLEAERNKREARRSRLVDSSLNRIITSTSEEAKDAASFHLDHFSRLTTRTEHIKQLRQTILNLAVRGRLVPQDPKDEPASLPFTDCDDLPVGIPAKWIYTRLANLLEEDTRNGYSRKPDGAPEGVPILRISAGTIRRDGIVAEEEHKLISGIDPNVRLQYGLNIGDLLACRFNGNKASVGRLTIFNDYLGIKPIYPDKLIRVRASSRLAASAFIRLAGDTDFVRDQVEAVCATTVGNWGISASNLKEVRFPLPPLAEQHRIVAKVDELMALCDQLETQLTTTEADSRCLLEAVLRDALNPVIKEAA
jgi:type I restriction enzyme, S subunit